MGMDHHVRLRSLLVERSLAIGDFTLSSGARSSYYIDGRLTTMSAEGQFLVGTVGFEAMRKHWPDARWLGGLTLGADPIAYAVAHRSWLEGAPLGAFTVRKAGKEHGAGRRIEGGPPPGARVVIVEDTLTSGASSLSAAEAVEAEAGVIVGVLALVDRGAGGAERVRAAGHTLVSLFTAQELLATAG